MDRQSLQKLRLDRRLAERRGWISGKELERELSALPDVSDKMTTLGEAEEEAGSASAGGARSEPQPSAVGMSGAVGQPDEPETSV